MSKALSNELAGAQKKLAKQFEIIKYYEDFFPIEETDFVLATRFDLIFGTIAIEPGTWQEVDGEGADIDISCMFYRAKTDSRLYVLTPIEEIEYTVIPEDAMAELISSCAKMSKTPGISNFPDADYFIYDREMEDVIRNEGDVVPPESGKFKMVGHSPEETDLWAYHAISDGKLYFGWVGKSEDFQDWDLGV